MEPRIGAKARIPNPVLKHFETLIGEWETTGTHPYIPDTTLHGKALFEWIEGGAFLRMRTEVDHPDIPDGVAIFGSDSTAETYYMIYFDERGVSRKYDVSVTGEQLKWWRDDEHLSQRVTIDIDKDTLTSVGEMAQNEGAWEKDLSLAYIRIQQ